MYLADFVCVAAVQNNKATPCIYETLQRIYIQVASQRQPPPPASCFLRDSTRKTCSNPMKRTRLLLCFSTPCKLYTFDSIRGSHIFNNACNFATVFDISFVHPLHCSGSIRLNCVLFYRIVCAAIIYCIYIIYSIIAVYFLTPLKRYVFKGVQPMFNNACNLPFVILSLTSIITWTTHAHAHTPQPTQFPSP